MPIEVGVWRIADRPQRIEYSTMDYERRLEEILSQDIEILDMKLLIIGRQVRTSNGKFIDLLAMDEFGKLIVIELKRDTTPRDIIAQLLDYASWVKYLTYEDIADIFSSNTANSNSNSLSLEEAYKTQFNGADFPETINEEHRLLIVAASLDDSTERIITYLTDYGVPINAVFFRVFKDEGREYLTRAWLLDPIVAEEHVVERGPLSEWNGEFYVNFGECKHRKWELAMKYGFISAGGGEWYTKSLGLLQVGSRIWVNVPHYGYTGVGVVTDTVKAMQDFFITDDLGKTVLVETLLTNFVSKALLDEENECFVKVNWIHLKSLPEAYREKGLFGVKNTVARPRVSKWAHTIETLKQKWNIPK